MQRILSILSTSFRDIFAHKLRLLLTSLGVVVGVVSVVGIGSAAYSLQKNLEAQFAGMGGDTFYIMQFSYTRFTSGGSKRSQIWDLYNRPALLLDYLEPLENGVTAAERIAPIINYHKHVRYGKNVSSHGKSIVGTNDQFIGIGKATLDVGRSITQTDINQKKLVTVIGREIMFEFFEGKDPIGQKLKVGGLPFTVIGVLDSLGSSDGGKPINDETLIIPITTGTKYYKYGWWIRYIVQPFTGQMELAQDQATDVLRRLRGLAFDEDNDFDFMQSDWLVDVIGKFTAVAFIVMIAISAIALVVAGIGIMNVMYVTVSERTKEIGIRKAVGAHNKDILLQFTAEAIVISLVGGLLGIGFLQGVVWAIEKFMPDIPVVIYFPPIFAILGILFSVVVGVTFGLAPAIRASKLNIVDALRS